VLQVGLQIPVLFLRASLDLFERRLAVAAGELHRSSGLRRNTLSLSQLRSAGSPAFAHIHGDFIEFTDRHWFASPSAGARGADIAARMMTAQELDGGYRRVANKIRLGDAYVASLERVDRRQSFRWLGWAGLVAGIALVWVVALG
jgi:hypothetical protein